jgi:hypothetical protein
MTRLIKRLTKILLGGPTIVAALLLCCCSQPSQKEIYGRYMLESPTGTEYLTMNQNGTYFQKYESKDGQVHLSQTNRWTYEPDEYSIYFQDPLLIYDTTGKLNDPAHIQTEGMCGLVFTKEFGEIRININEDLGIYFKKL